MTENEVVRLEVLRRLEILDTAAEEVLDNLTELAATICDAPICLISLVDENRQWFKSRVGLDAHETPRDVAFCSHAILDDRIMIVEDATRDERFAQNPLVLEESNIRFYAGAPLTMAGDVKLGTLCVIDTVPRSLNEMQTNALSVLREAVVTQLELRRVEKEIKALDQFLPICAWCRKVKVDNNGVDVWKPLHSYVSEKNQVTHGICPSCADTMTVAGPGRGY